MVDSSGIQTTIQTTISCSPKIYVIFENRNSELPWMWSRGADWLTDWSYSAPWILERPFPSQLDSPGRPTVQAVSSQEQLCCLFAAASSPDHPRSTHPAQHNFDPTYLRTPRTSGHEAKHISNNGSRGPGHAPTPTTASNQLQFLPIQEAEVRPWAAMRQLHHPWHRV